MRGIGNRNDGVITVRATRGEVNVNRVARVEAMNDAGAHCKGRAGLAEATACQFRQETIISGARVSVGGRDGEPVIVSAPHDLIDAIGRSASHVTTP